MIENHQIILVTRNSKKSKAMLKSFFTHFFSYSTTRSAQINSYTVGIIYRLSQIIVLSYIIGFELLMNKGYQKFESVSSVVTTKVKGQGFVPMNTKLPKMDRLHLLEYYRQLFILSNNVKYKILDTAGFCLLFSTNFYKKYDLIFE
jgi:hypothetical protein